MSALNLPSTSTKFDLIRLEGGLDLLTPTLSVAPGVAREAQNMEQSITGGYTTVMGYEAFDGRTAPSSAGYFTATITGSATVGATITGATSGATGKVVYVGGGIMAYTKAVGTFAPGESFGTGTIVDLSGSITDPQLAASIKAAAADVYRADIQAVPGSGPVRGVAYYKATLYAWRNNVGGTACAIYKSTPAGWVNVPLLYEIPFTAGSTAYAEGSILSKGGVTATVKRVVVESGDWGSSNAAGRLIITQPSGTFTAGVAGGGGVVTVSTNAAQITLAPNGRYEFDLGNFAGFTRLYGCDGVNRAFEFDGETLVPLNTLNSPDAPQHIAVHKLHLFISIGTNFQHSGIGEPYKWSVISGGAAYRVEGDVNQFIRLPGNQQSGALAIGCSDATRILYGNSPQDFQIVPFEDSADLRAYTGANVGGQTLFLSSSGVVSLSTSQNYGNFASSAISMGILPFVQQRINQATASLVHRGKSQYRLFFADGSALYCTMSGPKLLGAMPMQFPDPVAVATQGKNAVGLDVAFFGSTDGYVYQLDSGPSFNGEPIDFFLTLPFNAQGNARVLKRYRKAALEVQGTSYSEFRLTYDLAYGSTDIPQADTPSTIATALAATYWDQFTWDAFVWDGRSLTPSEAYLLGTGENIAIRIEGSSKTADPVTINSIVLHYSTQRHLR